jgi:putative mRNA 3-end processing factor
VYVTHGYAGIFARWLNTLGLEAHEVKTQYEGELGEIAESGVEEDVLSSSTTVAGAPENESKTSHS